MIELKKCTDDLHDETVMVNFHCGEGPDAVKKALDFGANARKVTNIAQFARLPDQFETESLISQHILSQSALTLIFSFHVRCGRYSRSECMCAAELSMWIFPVDWPGVVGTNF